jgi:hypothetical protein
LFAGFVVAFGIGGSAISFMPSSANAAKLACEPVWDAEHQWWECSRIECIDGHWCCAPCYSFYY